MSTDALPNIQSPATNRQTTGIDSSRSHQPRFPVSVATLVFAAMSPRPRLHGAYLLGASGQPAVYTRSLFQSARVSKAGNPATVVLRTPSPARACSVD